MLYDAYQLRDDLLAPWRALAEVGAQTMRSLPAPFAESPFVRLALAGAEMIPFTTLRHERPVFAIDSVTIDGEEVAVSEHAVVTTPFATLLHFAKQTDVAMPRVLVVAPLSGHYATLLRATVRTMLPDHDVYLTDWHNARDVAVEHGPFGLDDYIAHLIDFQRHLGAGAHLMAVCQPCPPALVATALLAADDDPATPLSLTLMAGPVDSRVNANAVNIYSDKHPLEWFERNVLFPVPGRYAGAGRLVYPGFLQATAFIAMNEERHRDAFEHLFLDIASGEDARAARTKAFYEEYLCVLDMDAAYFLDTVERVFQRHDLALGRFEWRGRLVDPAAITDVTLLTVEGAQDDITGSGQTHAAHGLCPGIPANRHHSHVQADVGHYGVFSGSHWEREVYPIIREVIREADAAAAVVR
jgi:poly(3-hydroxybutyrate) depolymerase